MGFMSWLAKAPRKVGKFMERHDPAARLIGSTLPGGRNSPMKLMNKTPFGAAMGAMPGMDAANAAMGGLGGFFRHRNRPAYNGPLDANGMKTGPGIPQMPQPTGGIDTAPTTMQGSVGGETPQPMPQAAGNYYAGQQQMPNQGSIWQRFANNTGFRGPRGGGYGGWYGGY